MAAPSSPALYSPVRVAASPGGYNDAQRVIALENENARLAVKIQSLQHELGLTSEGKVDRAVVDAQMVRLQDQVNLLKNHNMQLTNSLAEAQAALSTGQKPVQQIVQQTGVDPRELQAKQQQIDAMRAEMDRLNRELNDTRSRLQLCEAEYNKLKSKPAPAAPVTRAVPTGAPSLDKAELAAAKRWYDAKGRGCCAKPGYPWTNDIAVPYAGLDVDEVNGKVEVRYTLPGSPAGSAGIFAKDIITNWNGMPTPTKSSFRQALRASLGAGSIGKTIVVKVMRSGAEDTKKLTIQGRPVLDLATIGQTLSTREGIQATLQNPDQLNRAATYLYYCCDDALAGSVNRDQFANGVQRGLNPSLIPTSSPDALAGVFAMHDVGNMGCLLGDEFTPVTRAVLEGTGAPWLGLAVKSDPSRRGVILKDVVEAGPSYKAGLRDGDVVSALNDSRVTSVQEFRQACATHANMPGKSVTVTYSRNNVQNKVVVIVGAKRKEDFSDVRTPSTVAEIQAVLADPRRMDRTAAACFQHCDDELSGLLTRAEAKAVRTWLAPQFSSKVSDSELMELFDQCDDDRSGYLGKLEFPAYLKSVFHMIISKEGQRAAPIVQVGRPWLGLAVRSDASSSALILKDVAEKGPADAAGLQNGDVILSFAGVDCTTIAAFRGTCEAYANTPGQRVPVVYSRNGAQQSTTITVGAKTKEDFSDVKVPVTTSELRDILAAPERMKRTAAACFQHCDDDLSGLIKRAELLPGMRSWLASSLSSRMSDTELMTLFDQVDVNGSGMLGKTEFVPYLQSVFQALIAKD